MSTAISTAIYARLNGAEVMTGPFLLAQQTLAILLTTNPNSGAPLTITDPFTGAVTPRTASEAIRQGSKGASLIWPEVTFRASAGTIDKRFALGEGFAVDQPIYDFEVWDNSQSGTLASDIMECLLILLDSRLGCPDLPLSSGAAVWAETLVTPALWPAPTLNAWFMLWRLRFVEARF